MMMSVKKVKEAYLVPSSRYLGCNWVLKYRVAEIRLMMKTLFMAMCHIMGQFSAEPNVILLQQDHEGSQEDNWQDRCIIASIKRRTKC